MQRLIEGNAVQLNGNETKASEIVMAGDIVDVQQPPLVSADTTTEPIALPLNILYEDDAVIVLNKPAGLVVHPGAGSPVVTLLNGLLYHLGQQGPYSFSEGFQRPGIVHRLDKDTTGVMVCAKHEQAHALLAAQFADKKTIVREYIALLDGVLSEVPRLHESFLGRDPKNRLRFTGIKPAEYLLRRSSGKTAGLRYAKSLFIREKLYGNRLSLARVRLFTGRTHQIRVHAAELGLGIVGDPLYHRPVDLPPSFPVVLRQYLRKQGRQLLHAATLSFAHPRHGGIMSFTAPPPPDFAEVISMLEHFESERGRS